jgi:hypothetical protein
MEALKEKPFDLMDESRKAMILLFEGKLGAAGREFMRSCRIKDETLSQAIEKLSQFAEVMSCAGIEQRNADYLQEAMYGYFFHGLLQEFWGRREMDKTRLTQAKTSYELVEAIAGKLHPESYIFQSGVSNRFGFRETMRRRIAKIESMEKRAFGTKGGLE